MKKLPYIILFVLSVPLAKAQVQLNVTFHQLEDIRVERVECYKEKKDLIIELTANTFTTQPSFVRYELLQLEKEKKYQLSYNQSRSAFITDENSSFLVPVMSGGREHHFILRAINTQVSQCSRIKESIRLTVEPI